MIKKVMILVCVLTIGVLFASFTQPVEDSVDLSNLAVLTKFETVNKTVAIFDVFGTTVCSGGTGTSSWRIWKDDAGNYWVTPSLDVQNTGQGTWQASEGYANLMCKMAKGKE